MSTRSYIAILNEDKSIDGVYAHWDGYPSYNGRILLESYQDEEKVRKLISMGSISSLDAEIDIPEGDTHSFDNRTEGITVFYHRDREEELSVYHGESIRKFNSMIKQSWSEYVYVYKAKEKRWYFRQNRYSVKLFKLTEEICEINKVA